MKFFTIGHGGRSLNEFVLTLESNGIEVLVDIRKTPYSRYQPDFNKKSLENNLSTEYVFAGNNLGGSPQFGKDMHEYLKNRGENKPDLAEFLLVKRADINIHDINNDTL